MKITTTTAVMPYDMPAEETLTRLRRIGYTQLDMAFDAIESVEAHPLRLAGWEDRFKRLRDKAEALGVTYTQAHAPLDAASRDESVFRCFKACAILGIRYCVIHPVWKRPDQTFYFDEDEFLTVNVNAVKPLLEAAAASNVILLSENLLWGASSSPKIISRLVSEVGSPCFGWCFDTGHAHCTGRNRGELTEAENAPLSLHVQDNHGLFWDEHLLPGDGTIDWKETMALLKRIGYAGDLVLEAHHQSLKAADENARNLILSDLLNRARILCGYSDLLQDGR